MASTSYKQLARKELGDVITEVAVAATNGDVLIKDAVDVVFMIARSIIELNTDNLVGAMAPLYFAKHKLPKGSAKRSLLKAQHTLLQIFCA